MFIGGTITGLLTKCILLVYGYKSFQSIEATSWKEDNSWLVFWTLYSVIQFFEFFFDSVLCELPMYYELKLGLYVYLGFFGGATLVYDAFGKRAVKVAESQFHTLGQIPQVKRVIDAITAQMGKIPIHRLTKND
jgi:hypothetical protein